MSQEALCQKALSRIASYSGKCDPLHHQVTLMFPGNYDTTICWVLAALLHTTPMKENDKSPAAESCINRSLYKIFGLCDSLSSLDYLRECFKLDGIKQLTERKHCAFCAHCCHMGTPIKHPVQAVTCNFWHLGTPTLSPEDDLSHWHTIHGWNCRSVQWPQDAAGRHRPPQDTISSNIVGICTVCTV